MSARSLALLAVLALMLGTVAPAAAQEHRRDEGRRDRDRHEVWRDHDIRRFRDHDFDRWQHGHWIRGRHGGRVGWWWVVGPTWYYYPKPVYPYPNPYLPPAVAPAANAWYYCAPSQAYYPYIATCPVPWQVVPAR